ncbi:TolB family protein [Nonomuraea sp. NPDC050547]|uniref:TolB family protein n=1 Tax=Nonomuraea sp. NPDC050547 TaxID=3364368 RepID=UPI0037A47374
MRRILVAIASIATILLAGGGYVAWAIRGDDRLAEPAAAAPRQPLLVFLDGGRTLAEVPLSRPDATPVRRGPSCLRSHTSGGTTICLRPVAIPAGFEAVILRGGEPAAGPIHVDGTPSRARVSPSGRLAAWTVFRTGDSYDPGAFATTTGIYDTVTGAHHGSLEDFSVVVNGRPYTREDRNFWGVTFADDEAFYVTMSSAGRIWLMRGRLSSRVLTAIRSGVECPSLSPDGTRLAFKKRAGDRWRLHVLDLASGKEIPLAERAGIDDQAAWLDNGTVAYARPVRGERPSLFAVPADGSGAPRLLRADATSPAPVSPTPR